MAITQSGAATGAAKKCCNCGKNVAGTTRMKDSQGRYWCVDCGKEDQKKKGLATSGAACTGCGQTFPPHQLSVFGNSKLCKACIKRRNAGPGLMSRLKDLPAMFTGGGGEEGGKGKLIKMLIAMAVLGIVAWYINFSH